MEAFNEKDFALMITDIMQEREMQAELPCGLCETPRTGSFSRVQIILALHLCIVL